MNKAMPKSKGRGNKKQHRKRVENRNKKIKDAENLQKKYQKEVFEKMMKEYEKQAVMNQSKSDESSDKIDGIDGPII